MVFIYLLHFIVTYNLSTFCQLCFISVFMTKVHNCCMFSTFLSYIRYLNMYESPEGAAVTVSENPFPGVTVSY